jgi:pimeloyl-ACP methyl ester carboxylesterase
VVHDWGSAALAFAQRHPERIERVVIVNAVPLLPGYRWHRTARLWRLPVLGELAMGATIKPVLRVSLREANVTPGSLPTETVDAIYDAFDPGTQRAILRLYRSSPPDVLAAAGAHLDAIDGPALVVWGEHDPYVPPKFAEAYAARLLDARVERVPDAGHWPWLDRPDLVERIADFATAG